MAEKSRDLNKYISYLSSKKLFMEAYFHRQRKLNKIKSIKQLTVDLLKPREISAAPTLHKRLNEQHGQLYEKIAKAREPGSLL